MKVLEGEKALRVPVSEGFNGEKSLRMPMSEGSKRKVLRVLWLKVLKGEKALSLTL